MKEKRRFKVGDNVIVVRSSKLLGEYAPEYIGKTGHIESFSSPGVYRVHFPHKDLTLYMNENDLEFAADAAVINDFMSLL